MLLHPFRTVLTLDQITTIAPDAASLKAGRDLGTPRKWESIGGDEEVLWGLAMGSGKTPYQTRVRLGDLGTKCSCPSRKFPCKHALGLMFLAAGQPDSLTQKERPPWVVEWLDAHAARGQKAAARSEESEAKPVDEKAAAKRRVQRESRVQDGIAMLQKALLDLTREGLASSAARDPSVWETLAKRMVDAQAPGLAVTLRMIADTILRDPEVDTELPLELGRLHLLLKCLSVTDQPPSDNSLANELLNQLGGRATTDASTDTEIVEDRWFVAGKRLEERDRLVTSSTWVLGQESRRWALILKFFPVMQTIVDPWHPGAMVRASLSFQPGLYPMRATPHGEGGLPTVAVSDVHEDRLEKLLDRHTSALTANPFLRRVPFLIPLRPSADLRLLVDATGGALPWKEAGTPAFRVECICAGNFTPICGEWDGRHLTLLAILDGDVWVSLTL
jgi:hypothetical protein